nr:hypothetical protein [Tanacetum cinerariifolium]
RQTNTPNDWWRPVTLVRWWCGLGDDGAARGWRQRGGVDDDEESGAEGGGGNGVVW